MAAMRTYRLGLALLCVWPAGGGRANAGDRPVEPVTSWWGVLAEEKLAELAPKKGYVTSAAAWQKLWEAWRPKEKPPAIDFAKHLVLVDLGGMYPVGHRLRLTDRGDLQVELDFRVPPARGHGYGLAVIERSGVKTLRGKAIEPD